MDVATQLMERFGSYHTEVKSLLDAADNSRREHNARLTELEQQAAGRGFSVGSAPRSAGETFIESPSFKSFADGGARGTCRVALETKTVIRSASNSGGALIRPDRDQEVITLARRVPRIRDLLGHAETTSNAVQVMRRVCDH